MITGKSNCSADWSRAIARLFLFGAVVAAGLANAESGIRLLPKPPILCSNDESFKAKAIAANQSGSIFVLGESPACVLIWKKWEGAKGEFSPGEEGLLFATDIASDGGFGAFIADPTERKIIRVGGNGEELSLTRFGGEDQTEPVSVTGDQLGKTYLFDLTTGFIWQSNKHGLRKRLAGAEIPFHPFAPVRLEVSADGSNLAYLANRRVKVVNHRGADLAQIESKPKNPVGLTFDEGGIWILSDGLDYFPHSKTDSTLFFTSDTLQAWGLTNPADIAASGDQLFLLNGSPAKIIPVKIDR
jgi:hypothetical protein